MSDTVETQAGLQLGAFDPTPDGGQKVGARRADWFENQDSTEIETATRFSAFTDNGLVDFQKLPSQDDVDVVGTSADGSQVEEFQITRLWDEEFWKSLNTQGASDAVVSPVQMRDMVLRAVERKGARYSPARRNSLNLLIDTNPTPVMAHLEEPIREQLGARLKEIGFKSVWLVGSEKQYTYQLS